MSVEKDYSESDWLLNELTFTLIIQQAHTSSFLCQYTMDIGSSPFQSTTLFSK